LNLMCLSLTRHCLSKLLLLSINPVPPEAKPVDTRSDDRQLSNYSKAFTG
jgi:hypothetical protein